MTLESCLTFEHGECNQAMFSVAYLAPSTCAKLRTSIYCNPISIHMIASLHTVITDHLPAGGLEGDHVLYNVDVPYCSCCCYLPYSLP